MLPLEALLGEMPVLLIKQAGILGARNWFHRPLNILLDICDRGLASENLEGLGRKVAKV